VKKFDVLTVPLEVEYENPVFGFYRLIVPRFLKGGGDDAE